MENIKGWYQTLPIGRKISLWFLLIMTTLLTLTAVLIYNISASTLINQSIETTRQNIQLIRGSIHTMLGEAERYTDATVTDRSLQALLTAQTAHDELGVYTLRIRMRGALDRAVSSHAHIELISVYDLRGRTFDSGKVQSFEPTEPSYFDALWQRSFRERKEWQATHVSNYTIREKQQNVLSYVKGFYNCVTGAPLGVAVTDINETMLSDIYKDVQMGSTGEIRILDQNGMIISSRNQEELYTKLADIPLTTLSRDGIGGDILRSDGTDFLLTSSYFEKTGWYIVGLVPVSEITAETVLLVQNVLLILLLGLVAGAFIIRFASVSITRPITRLKETMEDVAMGDLETRVQVGGGDEIGVLSKTFNDMIEQTSVLMENLVEEQRKKRRFELSLLQIQMNPHFLYNTLENICGLAELKQDENIILLVNKLAAFYRGVLSGGNMVIPLQEEVENTRLYLDIISMTFQEKLEYQIDMEEGVLNQPTIKMLLQPLVENAVQHGIRYNKEKGGVICICGQTIGADIVITVADNGIGIRAEAMTEGLPQSSGKGKSFALSSTNERIKLYFGNGYGLSIQSEYGKGTTVTVKLPKRDDWGEETC